MEQEKKKNNGLIIVLFLVILGLIGFINYDKVLKTENVDNDKITNDEIIENSGTNTDSNLVNLFVGTFSYKGELYDKEKDASGTDNVGDDAWTSGKMAYEKLVLNTDGLAEAEAGNVRAGGYSAKGKWYISNNELIIVNEKCTATVIDGKVEYPNCHSTWTYTYKIDNNKVIITSSNNTMATVDLSKEEN